MKKRRITSPGKDSEMELEACVCQKFYLEFEIFFFNKEIEYSQARSSEYPKIPLKIGKLKLLVVVDFGFPAFVMSKEFTHQAAMLFLPAQFSGISRKCHQSNFIH